MPVDPSVFPEQCSPTIAKDHGGGRKEECTFLTGELQIEASPGPVSVCAREPEPSGAQGQASALQVLTAAAATAGGAADASPVHVAVAILSIGAASPEEASLDLLKEFEDFLRRREHKELMQGNCTEHGFDKGEASSLVHEVRLPSGQLPGSLVDDGLQLGSSRASQGEGDAQVGDGELRDGASQSRDGRRALLGCATNHRGHALLEVYPQA